MDTSFDLVALLKQQPTTKMSHKTRPTQFESVAGGIQKRLVTNIKNRKSSRLSVFDRIRNISKCNSPKAPVLSDAQQKAMHRKQQLEKWKEEKAQKKKEAAAQKKKPFVAGMPQRKTFEPPPPLPSTSGRVTRSQTRQKSEPKPIKPPKTTQAKSFAPSNAAFKPSLNLSSEMPTLAPVNNKKVGKANTNITFEPVLPKNLQKETRATRTTRAKPTAKPVVDIKKKPNDTTKFKAATQKPPPLKHQMFQSSSSSSVSEETVSQDTASLQDELHTPSVKVPKSESGSEEKLRSPKMVELQLTPEQIVEEAKDSPHVTLSRGKANARKEIKKKYDEGLLDEDSSNTGSVNHFRRQLNSEIARISAMCVTWDQIYAQTELPEPIQEQVLSAVGQARLLMSQKMKQFAGLVESCACPLPGASLITPADLQGFWDMVFMQVEDVDLRFKSLEELRLRNWIEEQEPEVKKVVPKPVVKKVVAKPSGGPSRLREMIAAARKAKQAQESQSDNSGSGKSEATASPETKKFEAGFFTISSPLKKSTPATPSNKSTLLKSVLSSEAKKSVSQTHVGTSFSMLRASMMSKNVDVEGVTPLPQTPPITVTLYATLARSILKQTNPVSTKKSEKLKTVVFRDDEPSSPTSYTSCVNPGVAPLPDEEKENESTYQATPSKKPATTRKSRLFRQNAEEVLSPMMTRSRRSRAHTPLPEPEPEEE